ncbi:MAG: hypothetical protein HDR88_18155 [Bacteroides sp.]|nr:hypothetical protein [Bacteroides sp.]
MRDAVTKNVKTFFVTCLTSEGSQETFQVPSRQYEYDDKALLRYVQKQTECELVSVVRKFVDISAYWMSTEDFLKYAKKGKVVHYPSGGTKIVKLKEGE